MGWSRPMTRNQWPQQKRSVAGVYWVAVLKCYWTLQALTICNKSLPTDKPISCYLWKRNIYLEAGEVVGSSISAPVNRSVVPTLSEDELNTCDVACSTSENNGFITPLMSRHDLWTTRSSTWTCCHTQSALTLSASRTFTQMTTDSCVLCARRHPRNTCRSNLIYRPAAHRMRIDWNKRKWVTRMTISCSEGGQLADW